VIAKHTRRHTPAAPPSAAGATPVTITNSPGIR
jgi:hypothetical protein